MRTEVFSPERTRQGISWYMHTNKTRYCRKIDEISDNKRVLLPDSTECFRQLFGIAIISRDRN